MKKFLVLLIALAIALLVLPISAKPALADAGGPQAIQFTLTCGSQTFDVVSPSSASAIAQVIGSQIVSVAATVVVTIGSDTFTLVFGPGHGEARGIQGDLQTCTAPIPGGSLTVTQFMTPRK